jgi:hypothetical protein
LIHGDQSEKLSNFGSEDSLLATAWNTKPSPFEAGATPIRSMIYIRFSLARLPQVKSVVKATLFLFANPESGVNLQNIGHSTLSGDNDFWLSTVYEPWDESTVNWQNSPLANMTNMVSAENLYFPATKVFIEDLKLDVTPLVETALARKFANYGFNLRLVEPTEYRKLRFASSEHPSVERRPRLEILFYRQ